MIFGVQEQLLDLGGGKILTVWPLAPAIRIVLPLAEESVPSAAPICCSPPCFG